jgi:hypothetical protein
MLYDTTYYANVKPRRGVRRLPTAGRGCGIRKRRRSLGAPCWSTATAGWSVPPGDRSARSVLLRKTPRQKAGLKGYERSSHAGKIAPGQRITYCAHFVARRSFLLKRRQAFQQAYYNGLPGPISPLTRNTLSQTPQPFGTRCQPCRCLRSSPVPSVVSATESNPTQSVSPSSFLPPRCHPMVSMRRFPI